MPLVLILLPMVAGALLPLLPGKAWRLRRTYLFLVLAVETVLTVILLSRPSAYQPLFAITEKLTFGLQMDGASKLFMAVAAFGCLLIGIFAMGYMDKEEHQASFFAFYLLTLGAIMGVDLAANLVTMYFFFELATLFSLALVLHDRTVKATQAALKYLFYSLAGAMMGLGCIVILSAYCPAWRFAPGGCLELPAGKVPAVVLVAVFLGVVGFGAKAGMFPLQGWLPTAHPVAPAPASALLSGIVTKAGVLAVLRLLYYTVGPAILRGTWVQTALLSLALLTVFLGSMMAYREKDLKRRLAYSSVSQISYVLTGLFLFTQDSVTGGLLHVLFHATIKICLFLVAGAIIHHTGKRKVEELKGIGKQMPKTMGSFTLASLGLIGIPPVCGFVSKWYLALGALDAEIPVFSWLTPVVLLVSALLTAGYLLPVAMDAFFPGRSFKGPARDNEGGALLWLPIVVLAGAAVLFGIFGGTLTQAAGAVAQAIV